MISQYFPRKAAVGIHSEMLRDFSQGRKEGGPYNKELERGGSLTGNRVTQAV